MAKTARSKDKYGSREGALSVEDLAGIVERSARRSDARPSKLSAERSGDERLMPVESLLEAQLDFNNSVGGSIKIIAQHLLYVRKRFDALEESQRRKRPSPTETSAQPNEPEEELSGTVRSLAACVDALASRLSELEQRVGRELDEIRRSIRGLDSSRGEARKRRNKRGG